MSMLIDEIQGKRYEKHIGIKLHSWKRSKCSAVLESLGNEENGKAENKSAGAKWYNFIFVYTGELNRFWGIVCLTSWSQSN